MRQPALVLALMLVGSACTPTRATSTAVTTPPPAPAGTPTETTAGAPTETTVDAALTAVQEAYDRYPPVLPLERRTGTGTLKWRSASYRLHFHCAGGGKISFYDGLDVLETLELGRSDPRLLHDAPCDGVPGELQVLLDGSEPRAVRVQVKAGAAYTAGVTEHRRE